MSENQIVLRGERSLAPVLTEEKRELLKRTLCKGASDDEFELFAAQCQRTGLDPFAKQIHAVFRWDNKLKRKVMTIQTGIDGLRLIAQRTGEMNGMEGPFWCGEDGHWLDVWLANSPPLAAKVICYRKGQDHPYVGVANFNSYKQFDKEGMLTPMWMKFSALMIAKCAEALALRRAFPFDCSGLYIPEEIELLPEESAKPPHPESATNPSPTTGEIGSDSLLAWLQEKDRGAAQQRRCAAGELLDFVAEAGAKLGFPADASTWGKDKFPIVKEWVKTFAASHPLPTKPRQPEPSRVAHLAKLMEHLHITWELLRSTMGKSLFPESFADLSVEQVEKLIPHLEAEAGYYDASKDAR